MKNIPAHDHAEFRAALDAKRIPANQQHHFLRWLRFYLDFCAKYGYEPYDSRSLPHFIKKLQSKNQGPFQQQQATEVVHIFLEISSAENASSKEDLHSNFSGGQVAESKIEPNNPSAVQAADQIPDSGSAQVTGPASSPVEDPWEAAILSLTNEIKVRHYSKKTLKSYTNWAYKLRSYSQKDDPQKLTTADVKSFLTSLAVQKHMSASSQNQAFNALLFFFRHVLGREFGSIDGVVRAKRKPIIPVVLTREEIDKVIQHLSSPFDLVVQLLYGCGLRLFECLGLRVNAFNFDFGILTVHDGKGKKDRTVPLPQKLLPQLTILRSKQRIPGWIA